MKAHEKLRKWREDVIGLSTRQLAELLVEKMKPDFPMGFSRGEEIFQSDIVHAEKGASKKRFEKVASAIYKYLDVPEGEFGTFVKVKPEQLVADFHEQKDEFRDQLIDLQNKLIDAFEEINILNKQKLELLQENQALKDKLKNK
ncbi:MAG: hypothetical protein R3D58_12985 [Saprospiraceae bacterium]